MNILQTIFKDHYEEMLYILHPRQAVIALLRRGASLTMGFGVSLRKPYLRWISFLY